MARRHRDHANVHSGSPPRSLEQPRHRGDIGEERRRRDPCADTMSQCRRDAQPWTCERPDAMMNSCDEGWWSGSFMVPTTNKRDDADGLANTGTCDKTLRVLSMSLITANRCNHYVSRKEEPSCQYKRLDNVNVNRSRPDRRLFKIAFH